MGAQRLDAGRVQHDAHAGAESLGRDVGAELCLHNAVGAVGASNATPDHAAAGASGIALCLRVQKRRGSS